MLDHMVNPWYMRSHPILVKSSTSQNCASFPLLLILSTCGLLLNSQPECKRPESKYSNVEDSKCTLRASIFAAKTFQSIFCADRNPIAVKRLSLSLSLSLSLCVSKNSLQRMQNLHWNTDVGCSCATTCARGREGERKKERKKESKSWTNEDDERCAW